MPVVQAVHFQSQGVRHKSSGHGKWHGSAGVLAGHVNNKIGAR